MMSHLTEDQMVALLQGTLATDARDEAKRHLGACTACADALAREAALDAVLWEARRAFVEAAGPSPDPGAAAIASRPARRRERRLWWAVPVIAAGATAIGYATSTTVTAASGVEAIGLFAWQNVIFYIPLAVGLLLIVGSAVGAHDHDAGHGAGHVSGHDGDVHHAGHHDGHDSLFARAFTMLGVGRLPLTVVLMIASLYFGGLGIILNTLLASAGLAPAFYGPIAVAGALVGMAALSGVTARLLHRHVPTSESYSISRHDFAGCTGTLLLPADPTSGYAQIKDREGNVHNIQCRTTTGTLTKGTAILVVEYDEDTRTFVIDAHPEPAVH